MSLAGTGTKEIEIDGATYELRRFLGWYAIEETQILSGLTLTLPAGDLARLQEGEGIEALPVKTPIGVTLPGPESTLKRLQARLCSWSHKQSLNETSLRNLPPPVVEVLLDTIDKLEKTETASLKDLKPDSDFA